MGKTSAPPIDGALILRARLDRFMSQADVQRALAALGVDVDISGLSRIENGKTRWPAHRTVGGLARLFGLRADELYLPEEPPLAA